MEPGRSGPGDWCPLWPPGCPADSRRRTPWPPTPHPPTPLHHPAGRTPDSYAQGEMQRSIIITSVTSPHTLVPDPKNMLGETRSSVFHPPFQHCLILLSSCFCGVTSSDRFPVRRISCCLKIWLRHAAFTHAFQPRAPRKIARGTEGRTSGKRWEEERENPTAEWENLPASETRSKINTSLTVSKYFYVLKHIYFTLEHFQVHLKCILDTSNN